MSTNNTASQAVIFDQAQAAVFRSPYCREGMKAHLPNDKWIALAGLRTYGHD